ncbi:MAG: response regulator [Bdellovibrionales bacterium]|nr:response regulator [Bdellovibrionales bacterium]
MSRGKHLLILERNMDLVKIVGPFLNTQNYSTFATSNIESALKKMDNQRYDLLIIDSSIGQRQVSDLLKRIMPMGSLNRTTAILMTTNDLSFELPEEQANRITKVLLKPYDLPTILGNVNELAA